MQGSPEDEAESTLSPFGRAIHMRDAKYFVLPVWFHVLFNVSWTVFKAAFWLGPLLAALHLTARIGHAAEEQDSDTWKLYLLLVSLQGQARQQNLLCLTAGHGQL